MTKANVLIVEDDDTLRQALADSIDLAGYSSVVAANVDAALKTLTTTMPSLVISDVRMDGIDGHQLLKEIHKRIPGIPVILMSAYGTVSDAVDAMCSGAVDYLLKPFEPQLLIEKINKYIRVDEHLNSDEPIAEDPKSKELLSLALRVAESEATVLITGESGTGKEVLARYIHDHSPRSHHPFVAINCAAIPEQMLEATLFGYEKGAFTGAYKAMPGKFEQAQQGTILLDEVSEMDIGLQAKLLRVLQQKEVERIGGVKLIPLDVRVLATSNRNLQQAVAEGSFREDLYYRINVFPLHWGPLRERPRDIIPMAEYLIAQHWTDASHTAPRLSKAAMVTLQSYSWPGNIREMDNAIQRALILHSGETIELEDLHLDDELKHDNVKATLDNIVTRPYELVAKVSKRKVKKQ